MSPLRATTRRRVQGLPKKSTMHFASSPCKWKVCCGRGGGGRGLVRLTGRSHACIGGMVWELRLNQAEEGSAPPPPTLSRYALTTRCARVMSDRVCVHVCCINVHECVCPQMCVRKCVSANVCRF